MRAAGTGGWGRDGVDACVGDEQIWHFTRCLKRRCMGAMKEEVWNACIHWRSTSTKHYNVQVNTERGVELLGSAVAECPPPSRLHHQMNPEKKRYQGRSAMYLRRCPPVSACVPQGIGRPIQMIHSIDQSRNVASHSTTAILPRK